MKKVNKLIVLMLVCLLSVGVLFGCGGVNLNSSCVVVINVESALSAQDISVTASSGTVTASGKKYTIALNNRYPMAVSISSDGIKTVNLSFTAKDFLAGSTITKTIEFGEPLDSIMKLNFKSDTPVTLAVIDPRVKITSVGNKFTLVVASRDPNASYAFVASAEGMEPFSSSISAQQIVNGLYSAEQVLAPIGKRLVTVITEYNYENSILTSNYKLIYGVLKNANSNNGGYIKQYEYSYLLDSNDSAVFFSDEKKVLIKGDKIETYGTVLNFVKEETVLTNQKLYLATSEMSRDLYAKLPNGEFVTTYRVEDYANNKDVYYIPLSAENELHIINDKNIDRKTFVYKFTEAEVLASRENPIRVTFNDKDNVYMLDHNYTNKACETKYFHYDFDTKLELGDSLTDYMQLFNEQVYDGKDIINNYGYRKKFVLVAQVDFGEYSDNVGDYDIVCNNFGYTQVGDAVAGGKIKTVTFDSAYWDRDNLLTINFMRNIVVADGNNSTFRYRVGEEAWTFDKSDVLGNESDGTAVKINDVIKLKNYVMLTRDNAYSSFDFSDITGFDMEHTEFRSMGITVTNESEGASAIVAQGTAYISPNAKFKITYELDVQDENRYGKIVLCAVKAKANGSTPELDLTAEDLNKLFVSKSVGNKYLKYPFDLVIASKNLTDQNGNKN